MSAITGIGERRTIFGERVGVLGLRHGARARSRSRPRRARRSAPSSPRRRASSSASSTGRRPARRRRSRRRRPGSERSLAIATKSSRALAPEPADVVREADEEEQQHERDPDRRDALVDLARDRPAADPLEIENAMWPPSSGSSGSRFRSASERLISAEHPEVVVGSPGRPPATSPGRSRPGSRCPRGPRRCTRRPSDVPISFVTLPGQLGATRRRDSAGRASRPRRDEAEPVGAVGLASALHGPSSRRAAVALDGDA